MPNADTHESANRAARANAEKLVGVAEGKLAVASDKQEDRFARTANEAARTWQNGNETS